MQDTTTLFYSHCINELPQKWATLFDDAISSGLNPHQVDTYRKLTQHTFNSDSPSKGMFRLVRDCLSDPRSVAHYNERRIIRLMWETPLKGFRDTMDMMSYIKERVPDAKYLPAKPKSIDHLHNWSTVNLPVLQIGGGGRYCP